MTVSDPTDLQRAHLAWRLDHRTACGFLTAGRIARGELLREYTVVEVFQWAGLSAHVAKIHARKVLNYETLHHRTV